MQPWRRTWLIALWTFQTVVSVPRNERGDEYLVGLASYDMYVTFHSPFQNYFPVDF
jgi:hypothetical protein